jgi:putative ABC transport system permease protein
VTSMNTPYISLPSALASNVDRQMVVSSAHYFGPVRSSTSDRGPGPLDWHQQLVPLYALTDDQLAGGDLSLASREARFANDQAVWTALRDDPGLVVSGTYLPGTAIDLVGNSGPVHLTVVGSFRSGFFAGLVGSSSSVRRLASSPGGVTLLLRLKPGTDPSAFALEIRRSMFPTGVEATTTRALLEQGGASLRNFASEIQTLLIGGLVVGVLSLGVQALRAVFERRRSTGLLRALGFQPRQLTAAMMGESLLAAAAGVIVGVPSGLGVGYLFMSQYYTGGGVRVQVDTLSVAVALALAAAACVTLGPALAIARTAPAQALRTID